MKLQLARLSSKDFWRLFQISENLAPSEVCTLKLIPTYQKTLYKSYIDYPKMKGGTLGTTFLLSKLGIWLDKLSSKISPLLNFVPISSKKIVQAEPYLLLSKKQQNRQSISLYASQTN